MNINQAFFVTPWTSERIGRLRELWDEKRLSAAQIADELGCSRNAVLGKISRLGLSTHKVAKAVPAEKPKRARHRNRRQSKMPQSTAPIVIEPHVSPADAKTAFGNPVTIFELTETTCRFPIGDVAPYMFCGAEPEKGKPYCKAHCDCAFRPSYYAPRAA